MPRQEIFDLFERMFLVAEEELLRFTRSVPLVVNQKADKTVVTECDSAIDVKTSRLAAQYGIPIVSEEGEQSAHVVSRGLYCAIDPIDGTQEYIECVNDALGTSGAPNFLKSPTPSQRNFCFLTGIVQDGLAVYGGCYNFVTKEKFLIDARARRLDRSGASSWAGGLTDTSVVYTDPRVRTDPVHGERLQKIVEKVPGTKVVVQGSFGLNALHALLNGHNDALVYHPVQNAGLWDIVPAAVAAHAYGGEIFDGQGKPLQLSSYVMIPGPGLYVLKG